MVGNQMHHTRTPSFHLHCDLCTNHPMIRYKDGRQRCSDHVLPRTEVLKMEELILPEVIVGPLPFVNGRADDDEGGLVHPAVRP